MSVVVLVQREAELLEVVFELRGARRLAGHLHRRQKQRDEHADDGNDDEQLHQREAATVTN